MKVPQYRSKMPLPKRTGAGTLTAQASPGIWGLPGAAQQEFGRVAGGESQMWGTFLLKTERATQQVEEEKKLNDLIRQAKINAERQTPESWKDPNDPLANSADPDERATARTMGYYDRRNLIRGQLDAAAARQLQNITDSTVRTRMAASVQTKLTTAMSNIQTTLQRQYLDYAKTGILRTTKDEINHISAISEGPLKEGAIEDAIKGLEYFGELHPLLPKEYLYKAKENFKSDLGAFTLRRAFTKIKTHQDAVDWLDQLSDPKKGTTVPESHYNDVKRLTDKQRTTFIERLQRTAAKLSAAESSAASTKIRLDAFKFKQTLNANYQRYHQNITAVTTAKISGHEPGDAEWPKDEHNNPLRELTAHDIFSLPDSVIAAARKESLVKLINQEGLVVDRRALLRHSREIREAFNEDELRHIEASIDRKVEDRTMGGGTYDKLRRLVDSRRGNTPGYKDQKKYGKLLNEIMNRAGVTVDMFTRAQPTDSTEQAQQGDASSVAAQIKFENLIEGGARPVEAFYQTIEAFVLEQKVLAGNVLKILDSELLDGTGVDETVIKDVGRLTKEHVDKIRKNFRAHANGRKVAEEIPKDVTVDLSKKEMAELQRDKIITFDKRKTMRELIKIEQAIDYLQQYEEVSRVPPPPPAVVHEKEDTKGVWDDVQDWVQEWLGPKPGARRDRSDD